MPETIPPALEKISGEQAVEIRYTGPEFEYWMLESVSSTSVRAVDKTVHQLYMNHRSQSAMVDNKGVNLLYINQTESAVV